MAVIEEEGIEEQNSESGCLNSDSDIVELVRNKKDVGRARSLLVAVGARILFYPTLFYNVVRNTTESEFHWWDQIDEFLLLGAVPFRKHVVALKQLGVKGVVTLNEPFETLVSSSYYEENGIDHCVIPTRDYIFAPSVKHIRRAVKFIREHVLRGETTYVHCKAGRGRSTTVVICYLVEHKGMNPLEAFRYIQVIRPRVSLASAQWEAVFEYSRQLERHAPRLLEAPRDTNDGIENNPDSCACINCEEPVLITELDLVDYEKQGRRWVLLKNLGLNLGIVLSCIIRIKSIQVNCKPVQHDFSIQLTTAY